MRWLRTLLYEHQFREFHSELMEIRVPVQRTPLVGRLATLWEASVRATHHFLAEGEVERLRPCVEEGLMTVPALAVAYVGGEPVGFVGAADAKVEMLFVAPTYFGRGVGKRLLDWAVDTQRCRYIDVNEQNERAAAICEHWGFWVCGWTETDAQGNQYPILRMRLEA